jgi:triacylglycerol lipase
MTFPPGFDQTIAQECALLVKIAYDQFRNPTWNLGTGYQELGSLIAQGERFGFVALNLTTQNVFVVFRGTQTPMDWMANLSFPQVPHTWGMVEAGFSRLYQQCSASVITAVKRVPGAPVFVTGHSLGGALATLATADLAINGIAAAMYNIASPRVGNNAFAAQFDGNVQVLARWRIANTEDIVTTVPLATPNLGGVPLPPTSPLAFLLLPMHKLDYTHVGTAVNFTVNNGSIIDNHDIKTYIAAL